MNITAVLLPLGVPSQNDQIDRALQENSHLNGCSYQARLLHMTQIDIPDYCDIPFPVS